MNNQIGSLFSNRLSTAYNQLRGDLGVPQTATDTIDKLVEKIQTSAAVEDRRTAVLGLKGLSRDWKEVSLMISVVGDKLMCRMSERGECQRWSLFYSMMLLSTLILPRRLSRL
jgi:AMMECR1 domain-containing protein